MAYHFSERTGWDTTENSSAAEIRQAYADGKDVCDLTVSNPTLCGFSYDAAAILDTLADPAAMIYDPDPRGIRSAREAVSNYYSDHDAPVSPDALVLTTSTSEGYSYIFRLLCDVGDEVLVPQPSYPLFEYLGGLQDVTLRSYPLFYDYGWWIDMAELERRIGPRTKAILVVHPNNPTGHITRRPERQKLEELCLRYGLALIVDEVFLDYPVRPHLDRIESFASGPHPALTFVLSGISKVAALPQMKVAWVATLGPAFACRSALSRLEVIADTFLSMNSPMQNALPKWLESRHPIQTQIRQRIQANLERIHSETVAVLDLDAGWNAVLRMRSDSYGEGIELALLREQGVIVHPGRFYGIGEPRRVVISLIVQEEKFASGVDRMLRFTQNPESY